IETPLSAQGELPKSNSEQTLSTPQTLKISLEPVIQETESHGIDHQESILDEPISSDIVHDTVLTTQNPHLDGEGMQAGASPNDTIPTTRVPEVFTSPLVEELQVEAPPSPSTIINDITRDISSQRYDDMEEDRSPRDIKASFRNLCLIALCCV
ncbi:hypothetical protein ACR2XN_28910, partial [Klebsiella pneumoniae]